METVLPNISLTQAQTFCHSLRLAIPASGRYWFADHAISVIVIKGKTFLKGNTQNYIIVIQIPYHGNQAIFS